MKKITKYLYATIVFLLVGSMAYVVARLTNEDFALLIAGAALFGGIYNTIDVKDKIEK